MLKGKKISNTTQTAINMIASMITYLVSMLVSFFLSPYIVKNIGVDANGFIGLANNFTNYASLITIALNTLATRFVAVNIYKGDNKTANKYYSSVFYANTFIGVFFAVASVIIIAFLDRFLDVSKDILPDVRILFSLVFLNTIIGAIGTVFNIATFVRNKLYLNSIVNIISNLIRAFLLFFLFYFLPPRLFFVGLTAFIAVIISLSANIVFSKKLLPEMHIRRSDFEFRKIKDLMTEGVWASVNRLGQILMNDLDLLISNMFINSIAMGVLSLSKTIPNAISGIVISVVAIFMPNYTELYAKERHEELVKYIKQTMKIMGIIVNIPIIVLIVCGERFFKLWQPTQNAHDLYILSILAIACLIISGGINCIYNVFTLVNKLRLNAIVVIISGALSTVIVFILLKTTDLGIFAIAGVSTAVSIVRNLAFTAPYGAKCLGLKWYSFYPEMSKPAVFVGIASALGYFVSKLFVSGGWIELIILTAIVVTASLLIGFLIILNKSERELVIGILKSKLAKKGEV